MLVGIILFFGFIILVSILLAKVEIQMEGKDGYAKNLPVTWRTNNKWLRLFFTGTSYHLYMGLFLVCLIHLPFLVGLTWSIATEMMVLSFLAFVTVAEDFLWFVLNPAYGIRKFKGEHIPWFRDRWLGLTPVWYLWYLPIAIALYIGAVLLL